MTSKICIAERRLSHSVLTGSLLIYPNDPFSRGAENSRESTSLTRQKGRKERVQETPYPAMSGYDDALADKRTYAYRQDLRERLRQREQKLLDLIRSSQSNSRSGILRNGTNGTRPVGNGFGNGGSGLGESNRLLDLAARQGRSSNDVDESDEFEDIGGGSSGIKYRYDSRGSRQEEDGEIRKRLAGIERVSSLQASKIKALENALLMRSVEVDELRDELVNKLERIVSLEMSLEIGESEVLPADLEAADKATSTPRQSQAFFTQLLRDLRDLEKLYKDERLKSSVLQDQLRLENEVRHDAVLSDAQSHCLP